MQSHASVIPGTTDGDGVGADLVGGSSHRATTFGTGRVCEQDGCTTRLSVYNSRVRCAAHDFDPTLMNFRCPPNHDGHGRATGTGGSAPLVTSPPFLAQGAAPRKATPGHPHTPLSHKRHAA